MTIAEFRSNPIFTSRLRELLSDDVMQRALLILHDSNPAVDPDPKDDAICSVRVLSQMVGYQAYAAALRIMSEPIIPQSELPRTYEPET